MTDPDWMEIKCACGDPAAIGVVHSTTGLCHYAHVDLVYTSEKHVQKSDKRRHEPVGYAHAEDLKREGHDFYVNREQGINEVPLYTALSKREWVGLTDEEKQYFKGLGFVGVDTIEAKLREKNHD